MKVLDQVIGRSFALYNADSIEAVPALPSDSIHLSVFSPPFESLYTYSATERDLGNSQNREQFWDHFSYLIPELLRVTVPGRNCCVHVSDIASTLNHDGVIGLKDFPGDTIRAFVAGGWVFHGRITIDKNPQAQAIRTHSKALLFVQLYKDASWSRPAIADQILVFHKPGANPTPVKPDVTKDQWIEWARPLWTGIKETKTLNYREARGEDDERHICPLQLETIERCVRLWSNPGETVLSPFAGIGSEGYESIRHGRRFVGIELKPEYFAVAAKNLREIENETLGAEPEVGADHSAESSEMIAAPEEADEWDS